MRSMGSVEMMSQLTLTDAGLPCPYCPYAIAPIACYAWAVRMERTRSNAAAKTLLFVVI